MATINPLFVLTGITIYADGGCLGNGTTNTKAFGSFAVSKNGVLTESTFDGEKTVQHKFNYGAGTSNTAELMTMKNALIYAQDLIGRGYSQGICLCMDSMLALNAAGHGVKKPHPALAELYKEVRALTQGMSNQITLVHIPESGMKMILGH